jgi:MSHA biogenesis protein MshI
MRWPFRRKISGDRWVVSWSAQTLAYVRASPNPDGTFQIQQLGVEHQGIDSTEEFAQRLRALGLKGVNAVVMLRPLQYQMLQIDAPPVAPEELRAAARYAVREMLDAHLDDITLDVLKVGDGKQKSAEHLFVIAATNTVLREIMEFGQTLDWTVTTIDIQDTAQRNLQTALAEPAISTGRAEAVLVPASAQQALLTISANEELFYTRRLDLPTGFQDLEWDAEHITQSPVDGYTPVAEYVPDYSSGPSTGSGSIDFDTPASHNSPVQQANTSQEGVQRILVEVQRSLDLWDRTWSSLPLGGLRVFAGDRSQEMATWLARETGHAVSVLPFQKVFTGLEAFTPVQVTACAPLLGMLLRTETRKL